ncbi:HutD-family protein [Pararhizobium polonicum]|uniref:HutD-family protein n=1 Tax=Pararhizobium polonicum TaxID=1612624 RepID=A0A1C7P1K8_9HYPH|nr:HutD family protein [Pararhizobium polonicum]OBZ95162.1 HutD-family protein [Pararhizobium polonicum]
MSGTRQPNPNHPLVLKADTYRRMPWKNGGGETVEIAVFPPEADLATFGWRISMATVASDGPFSVFPGIDRTLSILEGQGMELDIAGRAPVVLTQFSEPLAFPADAATSARLVSGTIVDLNVMTRRGQWTHQVEKRIVEGEHHLDAEGGVTMLLSLGNLRIDSGDHAEELGRLDCAILKGVVSITSDMPTEAYLIRLAAS